MNEQVYSCCHNILTVTESYISKNAPIGLFHAVKIAKTVFFFMYLQWHSQRPPLHGPNYAIWTKEPSSLKGQLGLMFKLIYSEKNSPSPL